MTLDDCDPIAGAGRNRRDVRRERAAEGAYYARATGLPAVADDSGLEIAALDNAPGVHSARWHGRDYADEVRGHLPRAAARGALTAAPRDSSPTLRWRDGDASCSRRPASIDGEIAPEPRGSTASVTTPSSITRPTLHPRGSRPRRARPRSAIGARRSGRCGNVCWTIRLSCRADKGVQTLSPPSPSKLCQLEGTVPFYETAFFVPCVCLDHLRRLSRAADDLEQGRARRHMAMDTNNYWTREDGQRWISLQLERERKSTGFGVPEAQAPASATAVATHPVQFTLRRDAGTLQFDGELRTAGARAASPRIRITSPRWRSLGTRPLR